MTLLVTASRLGNGMEGWRTDAAEMQAGHGWLAKQVFAFDVHNLRLTRSEAGRCPDAERVTVDRDEHGLLETGEPSAELGTRDGIHVLDCTMRYNR
jgi:hypothetical protein